MHFSAALVAALSISATTTSAIPLRHAHPGSSSQALLARDAEGHLARRNVEALIARGVGLDAASAKEGRTILARYAHIANDGERSMAVVRDLHRRGILDMLVAALRDIVVELLGSSGMARRQEAHGDDSHEELVQGIACLIDQMVGVDSGAKCSAGAAPAAPAAGTNATANATTAATEGKNSTRTAVLDTSSPEKTKASLAKLLTQVSTALNDNTSKANSTTATTEHKSKDKKKDATASLSSTSSALAAKQTPSASTKIWARDLELMARQEGVEGLLQVLRSLVDAILNTLLPMSSRDEDSSSSSASSSFGKNCPPPSPNDGMYRPGCPGYGRRSHISSDIVMSQRDASSLQSLLPMINMLIENLPSLLQQGTAPAAAAVPTSSSAKSAATTGDADPEAGSADALASLLGLASATPSSAASAATATAASKNNDSAGSAASGSSSSSSASTPKSSAKADKASSKADKEGQAPISAAKLSIDSRDLLDADGFEMSKRWDGDNADDNVSQDGNHGGIQVQALNDVLNNLLGGHGLSRRQNNAGGGSSQDGNQGGIQVSLLDNLLNGLLGGLLGGNDKEATTTSAAKTNTSDKSAASDAATPAAGGNNGGGGSSQDGNSNGINVSILNDLLNGLLGGLLGGNSRRSNVDDNTSQSNNHGGINVQVLNGLLNNLLGSHHARRALVTFAARNVLLEARADFAPVWTEIKKLGNAHFDTPQRRDASEGFAPVWSSFRDMVDSAYAEGDAKTHDKRAPLPTVDTKPFAQFAKDQMKEWTVALNEHSKAHGKAQ
ncbi:hypothetical protein FA10DRAFT_77024 [Acaromyces ingoldii]|uniref:Uncharacterized protein n=1 Tax=Acaromyces ingoldii TaxID=215250 RepID=A0A316YV06_9BASI|nr:hypothetical protein FA10DRAFT_77024 [Acaromyces ingoldii]PWN91873.1 hypothetical protein FA10DRAFT_77024 [Acaromyces ingoldii]